MRLEPGFDDFDAYRHGECAFNPDTLGLHVKANRAEAPLNEPRQFERARGFPSVSGRQADPSTAAGDPLAFPIRGRTAHETDHLLRTLGTSWGLMCHILQGRTLHVYLKLLANFDFRRCLGGEHLHALYRTVRRLGYDEPDITGGEPFVKGLHAFSVENDLRQILLGFPHFTPPHQLAATLHRLWGVADAPVDTALFYPQPPNASYPGMRITAEHILEGLGILKEAIFANEYKELSNEEVMYGAAVQYTFAIRYARALLEDRFDWNFQPVELEAALNLALWPPFVPSGLSGARAWGWDDIEPGYRFTRIVEWLAMQSTPLTNHDSLSPKGRDGVFRRFFHDACAHFGWPTPCELAEDWIAHLSSVTPWSRSQYSWWCLGGPQQLRTKYALRLLRETCEHPYSVWFLPPDEPIVERPTFSFIVYQDLIELPEHHCDKDGATMPGRFESYVFHAMKMTLAGGSAQGFNRDIMEKHVQVMPQFLERESEQDMAKANAKFLGESVL